MKTVKEQQALDELADMLVRLNRAGIQLAQSLKKCKLIGIKENYSDEELEVFDAFTSRFARVSDILTQKVFRLIDTLEYEDSKTFIDVINKAEARGIISSTRTFKEIRELRNEIAHEYALRDYPTLAGDVIRFSPELLSSIDKTIAYCKTFETR